MWNTELPGFDPDVLPRDKGILAAVSGGADSMCLLHVLVRWGEQNGVRVSCAHFDHRLRETSRRDADFVAAWCEKEGIPCCTGGGDVAAEAKARGQGLEETARELRYAWLEETAQRLGDLSIATAHTADDNAETLLMHLIRGSGLKGLTGIPARRGRIIRPFLGVCRQDIEGYNQRYFVPHVEDESNSDTRFTRNYLRHKVLPLLRELNPDITASLNRTAARFREDLAVLEGLAEEIPLEREGDRVWISVSQLREAPPALALRVIQRMAEELDGAVVLSDAQRRQVMALADGAHPPSGEVPLPGGLLARRVYDRLELGCREEALSPEPLALTLPGETEWGCGILTVTEEVYHGEIQHPNDFYVRDVGREVLLRPRREGDALAPVGRNTKTIKKWMIEEKIPRHLRGALPVLVWGEKIGGVPGLGCSQELHPRPGQAAWHCVFRRKETAFPASEKQRREERE